MNITRSCHMFQIVEVKLHAYADQLFGLVVQYTATHFRYKSQRILEPGWSCRRYGRSGIADLGPNSLTIFHRNSNLTDISYSSDPNSNQVIAINICT